MNFSSWGVVLAVFLSACADNSTETEEDLSFFETTPVEYVSHSVETEAGISSDWDLLLRKSIQLKTCIQDKALLQPLVGQRFSVRAGSQVYSSETDSQGCLFWSESMVIHLLEDEKNLQYSRSLVSENDYTGETALDYSINPWVDGSESVTDLKSLGGARSSHPSVDAALAQLTASSALKSAGVNATYDLGSTSGGLRIGASNESNHGRAVPFRMDFDLYGRRSRIDGSVAPVRIRKGVFDVEIELIQDVGQERSRIWSTSQLGQRVLADTTLRLPVQFSYPQQRVFPPQAKLSLVFRIQPSSGKDPGGLGVLEGEFVLDPSDLAAGGRFEADFRDVPDIPRVAGVSSAASSASSASAASAASAASTPFVGPVLTDSTSDPGSVAAELSGSGLSGFLIGSEIQRRLMVSSRNFDRDGFETESTFHYQLSLPLLRMEGEDFHPIHFHDFEYRVSGSSWTPANPRDLGRITVEGSFEYDPYGRVRWFPVEIEVRSQKAPYQDISRALHLELAPVPWEDKDAARIWDPREGVEKFNFEGRTEPMRVVLSGLGYRFKGQSVVDINPQMDLRLSRDYEFYLSPWIERETQLNQKLYEERRMLPDGAYEVNTLLVFPGALFPELHNSVDQILNLLGEVNLSTLSNHCQTIETLGVVCRDQKVVQSEGGEITLPVSLRHWTSQMPYLETSGLILMDLRSPGTALEPFHVSSTDFLAFVNGNEEGFRWTRTPEVAALGLGSTSFSPSADVAFESVDHVAGFLEALGVTPVPYSEVVGGAIPDDRSFQLLSNDRLGWSRRKRVLSELCARFYSGSVLDDCQSEPQGYVGVIRTTHLVDILELDSNHSEFLANVSLQGTYFFEHGRNHIELDGSRQYSGTEGSFGIGFPFLRMGGKHRVGWENFEISQFEGRIGQRDRSQTTHMSSLKVQSFGVRFRAEAKKCLWIRTLPYNDEQPGELVCPENTTELWLGDDWIYTAWNFGFGNSENNAVNVHGVAANSAFGIYRGAAAYEVFQRLLIMGADQNFALRSWDNSLGRRTSRDLSDWDLWSRSQGVSMEMNQYLATIIDQDRAKRNLDPLEYYLYYGSLPGLLNEPGTGLSHFQGVQEEYEAWVAR